MKSWVLVEPDGIETEDQLEFWLHKEIDFAASLPKK
jgi:hypothetical protein